MDLLKRYLPLAIRIRMRHVQYFYEWIINGYGVPAPQIVKLNVLSRYGVPHGTWVETGTYLGQTSKYLASKATQVFTIEASLELATRARKKLSKFPNIEVIYGLSEIELPKLMPHLAGDVSFWLDGHASGAITYGKPEDTPIRDELRTISEHLDQLSRVAIFVDDFRGFGARVYDEGGYPSRSELVTWANDNNLNWTVEHDIFIAYK